MARIKRRARKTLGRWKKRANPTPPRTPKKRKGRNGPITGTTPARKNKPLGDSDPSNETHSGIESTSTSVVLRSKLTPGVKSYGRWTYSQNHEALWTGPNTGIGATTGAGYQQNHSIIVVNSVSQMYTSIGSGYGIDQNYTAFGEMNPYAKTTGSGLYPIVNQIKNDRFVILTNQITLELANFTNLPGKVDVYIVTPKKLTEKTPQEHWEQGYIDQGLGNTQIAFPSSAAVEPAPVTGTGSANYPGAKPSDSKLFKEFWKVLDVKHLDLASCAQETINIHVKTNKVVKQDVVQQYFNESVRYIPNTTVFVFMVKRGALVVDTTPTPLRDITTYGILQVGWIAKATTKMCAVSGNADRLSTQVQVDTIPINALPANLRFMDIQDNPTTEEFVV